METTFITIHDVSLDARILYVSQSIEDILGYHPNEVVGRSCWEYFHPDEIPFAQAIHGRSIRLDKAAVLNYCQVKNKQGQWVGCECVFTVVHDTLVASTSIYKRGVRSQSMFQSSRCVQSAANRSLERAKDAPVIRRLFSSSPRDPRYHMLQYISAKFSHRIQPNIHEPRAALFLNRFSRTLTIMFATNGLASLLGITNDQLIGKSFYYCIQENCLREGVKCLESAKANDSIAYLRFWFRDPRQEDFRINRDERISEDHSSGDDDDGGVHLSELMSQDGSENAVTTGSSNSVRSSVERESRQPQPMEPTSRTSSGNSTDSDANAQDRIFDRAEGQDSRTSSISVPDEPRQSSSQVVNQVELEAVVSCTSDGLVVVLRKARPLVPNAISSESTAEPYRNGLFASPWANNPIIPDLDNRSGPLTPNTAPDRFPVNPTAQQAEAAVNRGPATETFINSIREVAVFAWALTGINGSLAQYGRGTPSGEAQPDQLQVWDPRSNSGPQYMHYEASQAPQPQDNPQPAYRSPNDQAAEIAARRYQTYSYITGLPDTYDEEMPLDDDVMQIDSQTGAPPVDGQLQNRQVYDAKKQNDHGFGQSQQLPPPHGSSNGSYPPHSQWRQGQ
ncbi:uncharacterized protein KY384_003308 [Bacidia gigantensis]|uniref:uncharacterized protein n=1 Tax=Bacidia gigantensis TaxID=2732470 RepID=UPI001D0393D9|nr:uncharacterized protein KY384_003308 [Bacidia gigantensis]KAG8531676.1 hypothetical protein KY384_003308 [Bacidia gigantensis]